LDYISVLIIATSDAGKFSKKYLGQYSEGTRLIIAAKDSGYMFGIYFGKICRSEQFGKICRNDFTTLLTVEQRSLYY
jgi:hypothetical protein